MITACHVGEKRQLKYDGASGRCYTAKDPIGFAGGDTNLFGYAANNPIHFIDPNGLSSLVYDRSDGKVKVTDSQGNPVAEGPAGNNVTSDSNGQWSTGTYEYGYHVPHSDNGPNDAYGSFGNYVFDVPGRSGMGVHSGRADRGGPSHPTYGCIRTNDNMMSIIERQHQRDPITEITVQE